MHTIANTLILMLEGTETTLQIFLITLVLSIPLGMIVNELVSNSFKHAFRPGDKSLCEKRRAYG